MRIVVVVVVADTIFRSCGVAVAEMKKAARRRDASRREWLGRPEAARQGEAGMRQGKNTQEGRGRQGPIY